DIDTTDEYPSRRSDFGYLWFEHLRKWQRVPGLHFQLIGQRYRANIDPVDALRILVEGIVGGLVAYEGQHEYAASHPERQSEYVDARVQLLPVERPNRDRQIVPQHALGLEYPTPLRQIAYPRASDSKSALKTAARRSGPNTTVRRRTKAPHSPASDRRPTRPYGGEEALSAARSSLLSLR